MLEALGYVYAKKKGYPKAQKIFKILSKFKLDRGSFGLGYVFSLQKMNVEALAAFEKAIEINPQYSSAWYNKGVMLGKLDRPEEALTAYEKGIEINHQDSEAWYGKGFMLRKLNRTEQALAAFDEAIKLNPQHSKAWYNKGLALKALHRETEEEEAFSRAKELGFAGPSET